MPGNTQKLEILQWVFDRMYKDCLRQTFDKVGVAELSNPKALFILRDFNREMSQKEIADCIGVAPPTMAVSLKRMEKAGLVQRSVDQTDQRRNRISLTEKGRMLTNRCREAGREMFLQVVQGMSSQQIDSMCGCYLHMIENMERLGAKAPADSPFTRQRSKE